MIDKTLTVKLEFSPQKDDPVKIFESFSLMLKAQISLQNEILKSAYPFSNVSFTLDKIESGSILAKITRLLLGIDENDNLFPPQTLGDIDTYVNSASNKVLNKLSTSKNKPIKLNDISQMINDIDEVAVKTNVKENKNFNLPKKEGIIKTIKQAQQSINLLPNAKYTFYVGKESIEVSKIRLDLQEKINEEKTEKETINNTILKIKMPDFLGKSKWKFLDSEHNVIEAKMNDQDWIDRFHNNTEQLAPGDSLDVEMITYIGHNEKSEYIISKVNKVIKNEKQGTFNW